jgi:hypothetical protein
MNTFIQAHMAEIHLQDLQDQAERARRAHIEREAADVLDDPDCVWVRLAGPADVPALLDLAELESRHAPVGPVLVAEVGGRVLAALPLADGEPLADPFRRTADLVEMLRLRAAQLDWAPGHTALHTRLLARLRGGSAVARAS